MGTRARNAPVFLAWLSGPLAVATGLGAHVASGGLMPALALLLTLTALLGLAASMLARVRLPGWLILVLCGLTQQLLHFAFSAFVGGTVDVVPAHGHGAAAGADGPSTATVVPGQDLHSMVYAHAAAALLAALIAARGTAMLSWARTGVRGRRPGKAQPRQTGPAAPHRAE